MGIRIYSEFSDELLWIESKVFRHALTLPGAFRASAGHTLSERLKILSSSPSTDSKPGDLIPYVVFWLSDSFRCASHANVRKLALALVYALISATLIDDASDGEPGNEKKLLLQLAKKYSNNRLRLQREVFSPHSRFWSILSESESNFARYTKWNSSRHESENPLSEAFLEEASRYAASVLHPALAGVAMLARREETIDRISCFLRDFCMGWRIADDLWDWEADLQMQNLNNSTILLSIKQQLSRDSLTREMVLSAFLDAAYVSRIYERILEFSASAKADAHKLGCPYLEEFMDNWLTHHVKQRDSLLESRKLFQEKLAYLFRDFSKPDPRALGSSAAPRARSP